MTNTTPGKKTSRWSTSSLERKLSWVWSQSSFESDGFQTATAPRTGEADSNESNRVPLLPGGPLWPLSWIQHRLLLWDHLLVHHRPLKVPALIDFFAFFLQLSDVQEHWEKCAQIIFSLAILIVTICGRAQFQINAALLCTFVSWTTKTWRKGGNSARPLSKDIVVLSVKTNLFVCVDVAPKKTSPIQLWPRWNPWTPCI